MLRRVASKTELSSGEPSSCQHGRRTSPLRCPWALQARTSIDCRCGRQIPCMNLSPPTLRKTRRSFLRFRSATGQWRNRDRSWTVQCHKLPSCRSCAAGSSFTENSGTDRRRPCSTRSGRHPRADKTVARTSGPGGAGTSAECGEARAGVSSTHDGATPCHKP